MFEKFLAAGLPLQGSELATRWDFLYNFLVVLSAFFFVLVVGGMIYLAVKYRRGSGNKTKYITGNHLIEAIWTIIPTILLLAIFAWGYLVYNEMTNAPEDAIEVRVIGKQWLWTFQYADGRTTVGEFYVPVNKPVKLIMTSEDVLHSFFIPNFRVKQDVVPGMYTSVWFEANVTGKHQVYCTEYCGTSHSEMLAKVVVLDEKTYSAWQKGREIGEIADAGAPTADAAQKKASNQQPVSLVSQGEKLMQTKGCVACHSVDGTTKIGPSYKGIWGHKVELADGSSVTVDENYIRESIEAPQAKVVKGFAPTMPTFKGLINETEMNAIISYIKSLK